MLVLSMPIHVHNRYIHLKFAYDGGQNLLRCVSYETFLVSLFNKATTNSIIAFLVELIMQKQTEVFIMLRRVCSVV